MTSRECKNCGGPLAPLKPQAPHQVFCSRGCRLEHHNNRRRAAAALLRQQETKQALLNSDKEEENTR